MKKHLGFTLLELMVVVGIIAILAALIFPAYKNMMEKGRNVQCKSNLRSLWRGAMAYSADFPEFIRLYNQNQAGSFVGHYAEAPARLPQYWVTPSPFNANFPTTSGWRGPAGLAAITNEIVTFGQLANVAIAEFPTLFRYVDRNIQVYACPSYKRHMRAAYPANTSTIYRNYVINELIYGPLSAQRPQNRYNLADLGFLSSKTQTVQMILFTEVQMPTGSDYGPSHFANPPRSERLSPQSNCYHNARHLGGMRFATGTVNAIFVDGHIESIYGY